MPRGRTGTPKLTPELVERITVLLRRGLYRETACATVGISSRTLRHWLQRASEGGPHSARFRRFAEAIEKAEAEAEGIAAAAIMKAGMEDWRALAWILERRGRQRYSPRHASNEPSDETPVALSELLALGFPERNQPKEKPPR